MFPLTGARWVGCLAGWVLGVVAQLQQVSLLPVHIYASVCAVAIVLMGLGATLFVCRGRLRGPGQWGAWVVWVCAVAGFAALGWGSTGWRAVSWADRVLSPELEGQTLLLTGRVADLPSAMPLGWRLVFEPDHAQLWADGNEPNRQVVPHPPRVLLSWVNQPGRAAPRSGERWQLTVRLRQPHGLANPHGFDSELWLWSQGVAATGYVRMGRKDPPPLRLAEAAWGLHPMREVVRARIDATVAGRGEHAHADALPNKTDATRLAGVLAALVVGDQAAIDRQDWDVFRVTGVAHLMAISGLHITLWAWLVAAVVRWVWGRLPLWAPGWGARVLLAWPAPWAAAWGGCCLALAYAVFSGWGVPAQRTVLMLGIAVALRTSGRDWPWPLTMGLALAAVLAWEPWAWLQAGFWLSFVAVGVLLAQTDAPRRGSPVLVHELPNLGHAATGVSESIATNVIRKSPEALKCFKSDAVLLWRTQWVMTLSLAPLTLLLFGQVSVVGFLANLVAIPVVTLVVTPLALAGVVWSGFWLASAEVLSWCMRGLVWLAEWPWASLAWPAVPWGWGVLAVCGGVVLAMPWPVRVRAAG
ncbi:MAG TPA: ComEC/Rec2 family competence protein, partial [Burkholderiaceae bacterium]|nr:ComEC/Rec2 family competence protein [Burkholderiaceae bacterium]